MVRAGEKINRTLFSVRVYTPLCASRRCSNPSLSAPCLVRLAVSRRSFNPLGLCNSFARRRRRGACHHRTMPRRGSNADRLLPVASCLLTFALALSVRMFWALPQDTAPVAAPMKYSAEAYWEDELLARRTRRTRRPSPAPRHSRTIVLFGRRWTMTRQVPWLRQRRGSTPRPRRRAMATRCLATSCGKLENGH